MDGFTDAVTWWLSMQAHRIPIFISAVLAALAFYVGLLCGEMDARDVTEDGRALKKMLETMRKREIDLKYDECYCYYNNLGDLAHECGDARADNPYCPGYLPHEAWDDGWCAREYQVTHPR